MCTQSAYSILVPKSHVCSGLYNSCTTFISRHILVTLLCSQPIQYHFNETPNSCPNRTTCTMHLKKMSSDYKRKIIKYNRQQQCNALQWTHSLASSVTYRLRSSSLLSSRSNIIQVHHWAALLFFVLLFLSFFFSPSIFARSRLE